MATNRPPRSTASMVTGSPGAAGGAPRWRYSARRFPTTIRARTSRASLLSVPDYQNVAVLDDVFFALEPQQTLLAHTRITAVIDQRLPVHHFGADELLLEIAVDGASRFYRGAVHRNRPGAHFRFTSGQKRHQPQQ